LEVVHDFETDRYWIICRGGKYTGNIIYMKGYELKTRVCIFKENKNENAV
jgi:hypothetical protein